MIKEERLVGVDDAGGPPVPIPNTEVKPGGAEDTWLEMTWENREMPTFYYVDRMKNIDKIKNKKNCTKEE